MGILADPTQEQLNVLLDGPALAPPSGVVPQLDHPPNLWTVGIAVQIVCLILPTIAFFMRMYTKIRIIRQVVLADYSIALGWAAHVGYFIPSYLASGVAAGVHQWDLRLRYLIQFNYYIHVSSVVYGVCIFFVKWSILLQYLQIFVPVRKTTTMYLVSHALIWTNFIFYSVCTFVVIFPCSPIRKAWDPLASEGRCINMMALNVAASTINSASDIGILILPQISIWRLQMSLKRKVQVSGIFLVGIFACVASIVRLVYAIKLSISDDISYYSWLTEIWTHPEMASAIIVACLPVSPKFFQRLQQTRFFSWIGISSQVRSNRRSTKDNSASHQITPHGSSRQGKEWPKSFEMLSDNQRLNTGKADGFSEVSADASLNEIKSQPSEACILRTVDLDTTTASRTQSYTDAFEENGRIWQGASSYKVNVMV
ncbi:MAG: hypothetical protein Q9181_005041 [Wetmoreana brouardii]